MKRRVFTARLHVDLYSDKWDEQGLGAGSDIPLRELVKRIRERYPQTSWEIRR